MRREPSGSGWNTDYPGADNNFSVRLAELTRVRVKFDASRQPHYVVVPLTDPLLYRCPMLFMEDIGTARVLGEEKSQRLREYLLKGGFLWVDDSWGSYAWTTGSSEIGARAAAGRVPDRRHPVRPPDHAHALRRARRSRRSRRSATGAAPAARRPSADADSAQVYFKGIQDARGRLMVLMTHNTDIADTWEREGESQRVLRSRSRRAATRSASTSCSTR